MADEQQKAVSPAKMDAVIRDSVQSQAHEVNGAWFGVGAPGLNRLLFYRQKSDLDIPPYGYGGRGTALRRLLRITGAEMAAACQAVYNQKVTATGYNIEGPQRTVAQAQQMLDLADLGKGFSQFLQKWCADFCTQDNGAFTELLGPGKPLKRFGTVIKHPDGMPVIDVAEPLEGRPISFSHIDSIACERTGVYDLPVRYYDINGSMHLLNYSRVHWIADMPQPDERLFGYGFSALSRAISAVQYAVNLSSMRNESLDNMPPLSIMTLENINKEVFEDQIAAYEAQRLAEASSLPRGAGEEPVLRTLMTLVSQDPTKPTQVKLTPIRQLWESFDELKTFQWLVNTFAMAWGLDPQEIAPLSSGAMGSGAQSTVLDEKAKGKGVGNALSQIEEMMRDIMPASCTFKFDRRDDEEDLKRATIRETKARTVLFLYTGSTGRGASGGSPMGAPAPTPQPSANIFAPTESPTPTSLIDRQQAQRLLMAEVPEWADIIDPDMTLRNEVNVDEIDPDVADMQLKMYGPRVRYHSKSRRTVLIKKDFASDDQRHAFFGNLAQGTLSGDGGSDNPARSYNRTGRGVISEGEPMEGDTTSMYSQSNHRAYIDSHPSVVSAKNNTDKYKKNMDAADKDLKDFDSGKNSEGNRYHSLRDRKNAGEFLSRDEYRQMMQLGEKRSDLLNKFVSESGNYKRASAAHIQAVSNASNEYLSKVKSIIDQEFDQVKQHRNDNPRTLTEPVSQAEIIAARRRLTELGIDIDGLRPQPAEASNASA